MTLVVTLSTLYALGVGGLFTVIEEENPGYPMTNALLALTWPIAVPLAGLMAIFDL